METTIDEVSIQIESNSSSAASGLDKLTQSLQKLDGITSVAIPNLNRLNSTIDKLKSSSTGLSSLKKNLDGVSNSAKSVNTTGIEKLRISMSKSIDSSKNFSTLTGNIKQLNNSVNSLNGFEKFKNSISGIKTNALERLKSIFNQAKGNAEKMNNSLKSTPSSLSKIAKFSSSVGTGFRKVAKITSTIKEGVSKAFNFKGLSSGLKKLTKYIFALFSIRGAYALVNSAANRWLSSSSAAAQQLSANIDYLKFSLGSAVAPAIEYIVSLLTRLLRLVQSIIFTLTGFNIFGKAFAKNMSSAAGSAKEIKKQLAPFDDLNVLDFGSGGGSGGGGSIMPDIDLTSVEKIDSILLDKIKAGDWYGVGMEIGRMINQALESIPWDKIQTTAKKIGTNIADLMNGLFDGIDWSLMGRTVGEGINTVFIGLNAYLNRRNFEKAGQDIAEMFNNAITTINWNLIGSTFAAYINGVLNVGYGFLKKFDFKKFGSSLMQGLNTMIKEINFAKISGTISQAFAGLLDTISGVLNELNWEILLDQIIDFFRGFDWSRLSKSIGELIGSAIKAVGNLDATIKGKVGEIVTSIKDYFSGKINEVGGDVAAGILQGIADAFIGIGQWINDKIFQPFINGFKEAFQIHSPSKVMEEQGGFIAEGIKNGIMKLLDIFKVSDIKKAITDKFTEWKNGFKIVEQWYNEKIAVWFTIQKWQELANNAKDSVTKKFEEWKNNFKLVQDWYNDKVAPWFTWQKWQTLATNAKNAVVNKFNEWKNNFHPIQDWYNNKVAPWFTTSKWQTLASNAKNGIVNKFNEWKNSFHPIQDWWNNKIAPWFTWQKWYNLAQSAISGLRSAFSNFSFPHIKLPHFSVGYEYSDSPVWKVLGLSGKPKLNISWYANGGFPDIGEMFIARENGPELVGQIGNRTAVANNDQIVQGIAQAAYEGVSRAMAENNGNERQPVNVYIGNEKIYSGYGTFANHQNNKYGTNVIRV